ncbi:hypothetical protein Pmani_025411 [Petrolisthes manimaculis]|uniref:Integral membrane protein DGCR2/IDD n=1 Tax=Petrolisthes manimaculis TaxID=1843537 RepID=A0AAE1P674_9EUCA|nr:hypothetical protein Pmani_025410 [Petrolisthes manimaculis]KAK4302504.1 hypothetical protein Pmani_025411 [Petrolisthes manimaculis]
MWWYVLLLHCLFQGAAGTKSSWECIDLRKERVSSGQKYIPGPDYCTVCMCKNGNPHMCQAVLCQPPQDCKSFRLGQSCCDFLCLDDMLPKLPDAGTGGASTDLGLRMVASAVTAILSLALFLFLVHRLRQRRLRAHQHYYEDQLDSPNGPNSESCHRYACCHNAAYRSGNDHVDFFLDGRTPPYSLWKPPSFYYPHGDAPPPYSEVVANSYRPHEAGRPVPTLEPLVLQLGPATMQPTATPSPGALTLIGAIGGTFRSPCSTAQPPCCFSSLSAKGREVALRSDEIYEDVDSIPQDLPPPYYPPTQPISEPSQPTRAPCNTTITAINREEEASCPEREVSQVCVCEGKDSSCHLCTVAEARVPSCSNNTSPPPNQLSATPVRLRPQKPSASPRKKKEARDASVALEEFQMRLSMDMSDSSVSSDTPTRTFSSSSDDSTSMDTTSDLR